MAPPPHTLHSAKSLHEATSLWYPLIRSLGWNRSPFDGPTHYHAALDGKTWLLITPHNASSESNSSGLDSATGSGSISPDSKPQGCVVALPYPNGTGWIGFFIMNAAYRGQGLGGALWRGMDTVWSSAETQLIGLDGVEEQVPTYTRRGFVDVGRIPVMTCSASAVAALNAQGEEVGDHIEVEGEVRDIKAADRSELAALDLAHTGLDRRRYWITSDLFDRDDVFGYVHYTGARLTGLVLVRGCEAGHRIGPLFAPDAGITTHLLRLAMRHPSIASSKGSLVAEIFGANPEAKKVFETPGWSGVGVEYHRMWKDGRVPDAQQEGGLGTKGMFAIFDAGCG